MAKPIRKGTGTNANLELYADHVFIKRPGFWSWLSGGARGNNEIRLSDMAYIYFQNASLSPQRQGYIQFVLRGEPRDPVGEVMAFGDKYAVVFHFWDSRGFVSIARTLEEWGYQIITLA